jgi:hypothetical protein
VIDRQLQRDHPAEAVADNDRSSGLELLDQPHEIV